MASHPTGRLNLLKACSTRKPYNQTTKPNWHKHQAIQLNQYKPKAIQPNGAKPSHSTQLAQHQAIQPKRHKHPAIQPTSNFKGWQTHPTQLSIPPIQPVNPPSLLSPNKSNKASNTIRSPRIGRWQSHYQCKGNIVQRVVGITEKAEAGFLGLRQSSKNGGW